MGGFITATTREGRPLDEVADEHRAINKKLRSGFDQDVYARRKTNTMFWEKATNRTASTAALQAAYAFLGVRLECAQCHKHPFDRWTQDDFQSFTSFFAVVSRGAQSDVPKDLKKKGSKQEYSFNEVYVSLDKKTLSKLNKQPPKLLGGDIVECREGDDPREALFAWMRSPENPYLAPAIANRLWGHYLGVGIVDPVDDFNAANPPSNPQLLDWLAKDFIEHKFDLKHLHRRILNSRTYQLSWRPNESNKLDERNFSHALLRRMPAEVVLDAINQITGGSDAYSRANAPPNTRAIGLAPSRLRGGGPEYVLGIFGRPLRTQLCDCERSGETGLAQAMYLLNDVELNAKIGDSKGRLAKLLKKTARDDDLVEELYLSALSRFPRPDEAKKAVAFIAAAQQRETGAQDLLWSLLNLREFIFVH